MTMAGVIMINMVTTYSGHRRLLEMFKHVKVGDIVTRLFAGKHYRMRVTDVSETLITAGMGWQFDRETGVEEDADLGWGVRFGLTGSRLVQEN
jgi:hypothetical protein